MRANLDLTRGAVASERLAHALAERLGRSEARALVREASLTAAATGRSLADELGRTDTGLSASEIETALDATTYLGSAPALVDRALERYAAEQEERA
jgi:nitrosuccinate lyase